MLHTITRIQKYSDQEQTHLLWAAAMSDVSSGTAAGSSGELFALKVFAQEFLSRNTQRITDQTKLGWLLSADRLQQQRKLTLLVPAVPRLDSSQSMTCFLLKSKSTNDFKTAIKRHI